MPSLRIVAHDASSPFIRTLLARTTTERGLQTFALMGLRSKLCGQYAVPTKKAAVPGSALHTWKHSGSVKPCPTRQI